MLLTLFTYFFYHQTAPTEIYTLSLHDALPISAVQRPGGAGHPGGRGVPDRVLQLQPQPAGRPAEDRKSTRLNSSHRCISYAVFCLKKKKKKENARAKQKHKHSRRDSGRGENWL